MVFETMDPGLGLKLLEGHVDTLSAQAEEEERYRSRMVCPSCGTGEIQKKIRAAAPFVASIPLALWDGVCPRCDCLFDPYTFLIKKAGSSLV